MSNKKIFPREGESLFLAIQLQKDFVFRPVRVEDKEGKVIADYNDDWYLAFNPARGFVLGYLHHGEYGGYSYSFSYFDEEGDIPYNLFVKE